jgi:transposase
MGKIPTETYEMLQTVSGDEALSHGSVFEWFKQFRDGCKDLQDDPRSGSPSDLKKLKLRGLSPQANYTDRAAATCQQS